MHVGVFPGASRPSRGPPGASSQKKHFLNEKCARRIPPKPRTWARLKFHAGWSGWTRPRTMAGGGGGSAQAETCLQGGVEGVLKGSAFPEAGCLGE